MVSKMCCKGYPLSSFPPNIPSQKLVYATLVHIYLCVHVLIECALYFDITFIEGGSMCFYFLRKEIILLGWLVF